MNGQAHLHIEDGCMQVSGELNFASVIPLQAQGGQWLQTAAPARCFVDLSGVTQANSAGTTLLLSWLRSARAAGKQLTIRNMPATLTSLMELIGLGSLLDDLDVLEK